MTQVIYLPQRQPRETQDDYLISQAHLAFKGKGKEAEIAMLVLQIEALEHLIEEERVFTSSSDVRVFSTEYHKPESVYLDLNLYTYGIQPFTTTDFRAIDFFAIEGQTKKTRAPAGVVLDFFNRQPTQTLVYAQTSPDAVKNVARTVFPQQAYRESSQAFSESSVSKISKRYGLVCQRPEATSSVTGTLHFGGRGISQGDVVCSLMNVLKENESFLPMRYHLQIYQFPIDFPIQNGVRFERGMEKLGECIRGVYDKKLAQTDS